MHSITIMASKPGALAPTGVLAMPPLKIALAAILVFGAPAGAAMAETKTAFDFGQPITSADLQRYLSIPPNGAGLPPGHGDASQGRMVYEEKSLRALVKLAPLHLSEAAERS